MKKIETFALYLMMLVMVGCLAWSCSDDEPDDFEISKRELPAKARDFIDIYFPGNPIKYIDMDPDYDGAEYEVKFNDGTEIEFDRYGDWVKIEAGKWGVIPEEIVPGPIMDFVSFRYPKARIVEISRHLLGWEVELSNDVDIRFSNDFEVLEIDK